MTVCTRFAPSPTGYLHVGGARTALYCWLYTRKHHGQFILRIEDTDLERSTPEAVTAILDGMAWLELNYDAGPFYQTQRMARYQEVLTKLLQEGTAYRCYCSKERLETLRAEQTAHKQKPRYDGLCRHRADPPSDAPYVIRFRNPQEGAVIIDDLVRGRVVVSNEELDDLILARSDGSPTYNFCVVVDDWDMQVTHVIRGDDHLNNTPRQINILKALNAPLPQYAHVPMILGSDGQRLSKRHGAVSVLQYRDEGYLPIALLNYLVRLGWSHGDQEIFSLEEMIAYFDIKDVHKAPAGFNPEKLLWLNQHYLKTLSIDQIVPHLRFQFQRLGIDEQQGPVLSDVILAQRERAKTLQEMAERSRFWYSDAVVYDEQARAKHLTAESRPILHYVATQLDALTSWSDEAIHAVVEQAAAHHQCKMGMVAQPLRVALTGNTVSPSIDVTIRLLGRERAVARIKNIVFPIEF